MAGSVKSSFTKFKGKSNTIPGTKASVQSAQLLISSGCQSFDQIIGCGIPVGSIVVIEEDKYVTFSKLFMKYFLAEGIASSHAVFVGSHDVDTKQLMTDLPSIIDLEHDKQKTEDSDMVIAWRYKKLDTVNSSPLSSYQFGHFFDLSNKIDSKLLNYTTVTHWDHENSLDNEYDHLLNSIADTLTSGSFTSSKNPTIRNILRIGVLNLGSPVWNQSGDDVVKFLFSIRALLRSAYATCMVTIPTHLLDTSTRLKIELISDICIKLDSFTGTHLEKLPALKEYHGFLKVVKLAAINTLVPHIPEALDLAFKLRRKKLLIEKLHLPPELEDSTEREQDDLGGLSCALGSKGTNKLDF